MECRINAEHPIKFTPHPGTVTHYHPPGGFGVRVDSHLYSGYTVPPYYDSLIAKVVCWGEDRRSAFRRMKVALDELLVEGITTNIALHRRLVRDGNVKNVDYTIHYLEKLIKDLEKL